MITKITNSPLANKRLRAEIETKLGTKVIDFGFKLNGRYGTTFIDGADVVKRKNYWARHLANETEYKLINNLVPSPSLLSAYILWGNTRDVGKNVKHLNTLWAKAHGNI